VTANGGAALAAGGAGGSCDSKSPGSYAAGIHLLCDRGLLHNSGNLSDNGGGSLATSGGADGGHSSGIHLEGPVVENHGDLSANGGDTNPSSGRGGNAGNVLLHSIQGVTTNTGSLSSAGGTGAPGKAGSDGFIVVDDQIQ